MMILLVVKSMAIETLGPMYLQAIAKQAGHECRIVTLEEASIATSSYKPSVIGYSVMTGDQRRFIAMNDHLKRKHKFVAVFGGPHATFFPKDFTGNSDIGLTIQGEAENEWAELFGGSARYPDLDSIPWPDRTDFPNHSTRDFIASRGCTNSCAYCYNSAWNKMYPELSKIRYRSARDVVSEVFKVQPQFAYFQDSTFGVSLKWLKQFSQEYKRLHIPFHVHLRPNLATQERVILLSDAGCVSVKIALETASSRLRTLINRGKASNEDVYLAGRVLKKERIALILQNILALPTATIEDDLHTLEVNIRTRPAYAWSSIFQPYPGTDLAEFCVDNDLYKGDYSEIADNFFDESVLALDEVHREQVACLQRIFAFCVEMQTMPEISDLSWERLPKFIHNTMRKVGDRRMFGGA
jgi:anaerobic magnesium-protoporphyrin IX monomethyl ester cyclase